MFVSNDSSELDRIKTNIENSYQGFKKNYDNFTEFQRFIFITAMNEAAESVNNEIDRPNIEINNLEAYISRFCGEFVKNEPGISVSASDDFDARNPEQEVDVGTLSKFLEGHIRHIRHESAKVGTAYNCYRDALSGGFSGLKIHTEYADSMSFKQVIKMSRVFDPILTGYDMLATKPDKSDGNYCFELFPMRKEDFKRQFKDVEIGSIKYVKSLGSFNWSYMLGKEEIILVADYYEKEEKKTKLYELSNGQIMVKKEYNEFIKKWEESGIIDLPPIIIQERDTTTTEIIRYQLIQNQILSEEPTDYTDLPIKFIDGNSVIHKDDLGGSSYQFTRPFIYQARGVQRLKNFAAQCLADELQKMRPAQIIAALEAIPEQYIDGYRDPKALATIIYNYFHNGDVNHPLPAPLIAPRHPIPPEIMNTLMSSDTMIQNVLGIFDASLSRVNGRDVSGEAIRESTGISNSVVVPYIYNHDLGFESAAQMILDMIPLYYNTPRTLPIITEEGKKIAINVNAKDGSGLQLKYKPGDFKVKVEASVSFVQQQERAMQQIISLMQVPQVAQFVGDTSIDLLFDNISCRDAETWRGRSEIWMKSQQEAKQVAMQQAAQQPAIEQQAVQIAAQQVQMEAQVAMAKVEQQAMAEKAKTAVKVAELELDKQKLQIELAKLTAELHIEEQKLGIEQQKADDDRIERIIDSAIKQNEHTHGMAEKQFDRAMKKLESDRAHESEKAEKEMVISEKKINEELK